MNQVLRRLAALAALAVLVLSAAAALGAGKAAPDPAIDLTWGARIPLRDGVRLNATIYRPAGQAAPLPAVFTLTPYISDTYHERAMYFARHGYVFALVDVRGRGNSEGIFEPFAKEARDGADVVEWLATQPWCDGKVAMWGGSYAGFDQWAVLKEHPPHLATIVPAAAARPGVDFPFFKNVFSSYVLQWLTLTSGDTPNWHLFGESSFWLQKYRELAVSHRPFRELDRVVGNTSTVFQKWLEHPRPDAYWDSMAPTPEDYRKIDIPILTITGDYDGDQPGAMSYYREHMEFGSAAARARHYLVIGPWDHAGTRTPKRNVGGLEFGPASLVDLNDLHRRWYDWTMKDGARPDFLKRRVAYYVVGPGAEEWKYADDLDSISTPRKLYLDSADGRPDEVFHAGTLSEEAPKGASPDSWTDDPLDTRFADLETKDVENFLTDQTDALNLFGGGVVYHTAPFPKPEEISGFARLALWMSLDVPDTDFQAELSEILPDGSSVLLTSDLVRARYRDSLRAARLVTPGKIERYDFTGFAWFSRRVSKGSRLRLLIRSPQTISLERNYNGAGPVAEESGKDARAAHVRLYHDAKHPSALEIPVAETPSP
jgi:putative CocE/NonD family hydrolase